MRQGPLRLGLREVAAAADHAADPPRESYPKGPLSSDVRGEGRGRRKPGGIVSYDEVLPHSGRPAGTRPDLIADRLKAIHGEHGLGSIAGFGSAKCSNEEAYLFQKLIRAGFGTNNVDHCTRLCHASSALFEGVGSGAVSTTYGDIVNSDVAILAGTNTTANHPVASSFFKQAKRRGTTDRGRSPAREDRRPRRHLLPDQAGHRRRLLQRRDARDHPARSGGPRVHRAARHERRAGEGGPPVPPERAAQICGIEADTIREVARLWGEAGAAIIFWGMGISQHTTGTDNALPDRAVLDHRSGRPSGVRPPPAAGQNNVQGASDAGLIPMFYPDYQLVTLDDARERFETAWGREPDRERGLTVTEIVASALKGGVRGMYMMGENPFLSDPNVNKVRKALASLEFLAVQDIFLTETAEFADVILPASSYMEKDGTYTNTDRRRSAARCSSRRARRARIGASSATSRPASVCRWSTTLRARSSTSSSR